jgi:adenylate cyclase
MARPLLAGRVPVLARAPFLVGLRRLPGSCLRPCLWQTLTIGPRASPLRHTVTQDATQPSPQHKGSPQNDVAVLFADVAGSTRLYEVFGDERAKTLIDECLRCMREATVDSRGRVVKLIGDELMCVFPDAEHAYLAATEMQVRVSQLSISPSADGVMQPGPQSRAIRVGFHAGPVIEDDGDIFGDTVNVASRMTGLAKGNQIMTTGATVSRLPELLRVFTREIAALAIRGKGDAISVYEVIWQAGEDLTMAITARPSAAAATMMMPQSLRLERGELALVLDLDHPGVTMGRDPQCAILIADRQASRQHARVERRRDKFFLVDQSTNGTFITFDGEPELMLLREEVMLRGRGRISFGHSAADGDETVRFSMVR